MIEFEGRRFAIEGNRIYEGDHVHSCGFYERALIEALEEAVMHLPQKKASLADWLREAATELDKAHRVLDDYGVPREHTDGIEFTLAARIAVFGAELEKGDA